MAVEVKGNSVPKQQPRLLRPLNCLLSAQQVFDRLDIMMPSLQLNYSGQGSWQYQPVYMPGDPTHRPLAVGSSVLLALSGGGVPRPSFFV